MRERVRPGSSERWWRTGPRGEDVKQEDLEDNKIRLTVASSTSVLPTHAMLLYVVGLDWCARGRAKQDQAAGCMVAQFILFDCPSSLTPHAQPKCSDQETTRLLGDGTGRKGSHSILLAVNVTAFAVFQLCHYCPFPLVLCATCIFAAFACCLLSFNICLCPQSNRFARLYTRLYTSSQDIHFHRQL